MQKKKNSFTHLEQELQKIPTLRFGFLVFLLIALLILWLEPDLNKREWRNVLRLLLSNAETLAIVTGVAVYLREVPDRKEQKYYQAWQVIDSNAIDRGHKYHVSFARNKALKDLNREGVSLEGINLSGADLKGLDLHGAILRKSNLNNANLSNANLNNADLSGASVVGTIFDDADLRNATFTSDNNGLSDKQLDRAKLCNTTLPERMKIDSNRNCTNNDG